MKLLRRKVGELEAAQAAGGSRPIALVWTSDNERIGEEVEFGPGEHLATDVYVLEDRDSTAGETPSRYKLVERVTSNPDDWGVVRQEHGVSAIGRVRESRPPYLDIEWFSEEPGG